MSDFLGISTGGEGPVEAATHELWAHEVHLYKPDEDGCEQNASPVGLQTTGEVSQGAVYIGAYRVLFQPNEVRSETALALNMFRSTPLSAATTSSDQLDVWAGLGLSKLCHWSTQSARPLACSTFPSPVDSCGDIEAEGSHTRSAIQD